MTVTQNPGSFPFVEFINKLVLPFKDIDESPLLCINRLLKKKSILFGNNKFFRAKDFTTREEVALMLERLAKLFVN
jgi:hypothetical protein